jgi:hypothetical protein
MSDHTPTEPWTVTWSTMEMPPSGRYTKILPRLHHRTFGSQREAVSFAMGLNRSIRRSTQLLLPGGPAVGIDVIEQMHDAQESVE